MKRKHLPSLPKSSIHFKQPEGLRVIAIITFFICFCIAPSIALLTHTGEMNFFYSRNDRIFVIFFACIFGCFSNYLFGSTKSIMHGLQFIIIALIMSSINNIYLFSAAALWTGVTIVIVNLLFNLSSFYLKTDMRRLCGFIVIYSSALLGTAVGIALSYMVFKNIDHFRLFYIAIVFAMMIYVMKNNYKLNTSLVSQTERIDVSTYGVMVIFFIFTCILFYLFLHVTIFAILNVIILPVSLVLLIIITLVNNKENGVNLLKYVFFSLFLIVLNKSTYILFSQHQSYIGASYLNSSVSAIIILMIGFVICLLIYVAWRLKLISLQTESITNSNLVHIMLYLETARIITLTMTTYTNNPTINSSLFLVTTVLGLILNVFIIPIYFSLGKILAGGKNEITTTTLLYLIFSSLAFVSFLYDISVRL